MLSIKCKNCSATNTFEEDSIPSFCSFCGAALPNMLPFVEEAIRINQERQRHQMEIEKIEKKIKKEKATRLSDIIAMIPLIILIIFAALFFYGIYSLIKT